MTHGNWPSFPDLAAAALLGPAVSSPSRHLLSDFSRTSQPVCVCVFYFVRKGV